MVYSVKGFHTCRADGTKEELQEKVPFLSECDDQWLGRGYYFWTDTDYWAHKWLKGEKVISRFNIKMKRDGVLNLVDSVEDQITFKKILDCFSTGVLGMAYQEKFNSEICVSQVLTWLREECKGLSGGIFPYGAVKAKDYRREGSVPFLANPRSREELPLVERHQICVYDEFKEEAVTFEGFVHPAHFMDVTDGAMV
nr:hypothetical protein [uncultured Pseudomonas sp.]